LLGRAGRDNCDTSRFFNTKPILNAVKKTPADSASSTYNASKTFAGPLFLRKIYRDKSKSHNYFRVPHKDLLELTE
jgi:hypothetical protein